MRRELRAEESNRPGRDRPAVDGSGYSGNSRSVGSWASTAVSCFAELGRHIEGYLGGYWGGSGYVRAAAVAGVARVESDVTDTLDPGRLACLLSAAATHVSHSLVAAGEGSEIVVDALHNYFGAAVGSGFARHNLLDRLAGFRCC